MATSFDSTLSSLGIGRTNSGAQVKTATQADALTQNDFLKLLTAQLKNQDPTAPVDATQQLSQLAQFSSVAGISEINTTLKSIQDKLSGGTTSDALGYVGRTVLAPGTTAYPRTDGGLTGAVELAGDATDVKVAITGSNGALLKTLSLGAQAKGSVTFDWDGSTNNGDPAGAGPFKISAIANNNGASIAATPLVWAPVSSVSIPASGPPILTVPGIGQIATTQVRQIG
ncbi:flagellar hook assembly protein FlgD [Sphingomonas sp. 28-63-12]|uniref:flagellar hook assembly protein FlgD n=1 Tax=Sphingomonas sp. 28-63-12 TaxID=1970434 RepID=UPI000BC773F6|nr:MAG: flagellar hook capping protein [Sphingomonas sp. 28-63-12]